MEALGNRNRRNGARYIRTVYLLMLTIDPAAAEVALITLALIVGFWTVGKIVRYVSDLWHGVPMERDHD